MNSILSILIALTATAQLPPGDGSKVEILMPGMVFADQITTKPGDVWWVLFQAAGEEVRLRYAPLAFMKQPDAPSHNFISAMGFPDNEVILLFRGTRELPRGPVSTVFCGRLAMAPGTTLSFQDFSIQAHPFKTVDVDSVPVKLPTMVDYEIRLIQREATRQVLFRQSRDTKFNASQAFNHRFPMLLWAGDLDKDHKLDLLLDVSTDSPTLRHALFLSTYAEGGELVHLVAEHEGSGC